MATKIGDQLTAALNRLKTADTEGPQRTPSTHPTATEPNHTIAPSTGEAETVMASDVKKIPTPAGVGDTTPPDTIKPDVLPAGGDKAARRKIGSLDDMYQLLAETLVKKADDMVPAAEPNTTVEGGDKKYGPQVGLKQAPTGEDPKNETAGAAMTQKDHAPTTHPANLEGAPADGVAFKSAKKARVLRDEWNKKASLYAATLPSDNPVVKPATKNAAFDVDENVSNYLAGHGLAGLVDGDPDTMVKTAQALSAPNIEKYAQDAYISAMRLVNFCKAAEEAAAEPEKKPEEESEPAAPAGASSGGSEGGGGEEMSGGGGGEGGSSEAEMLQNLVHALLAEGVSEEQVMQMISGEGGGGGGGEAAGGGMPPPAAGGAGAGGGMPPEAAGGAGGGMPPEAAGGGMPPKTASRKNSKQANTLLSEILGRIVNRR